MEKILEAIHKSKRFVKKEKDASDSFVSSYWGGYEDGLTEALDIIKKRRKERRRKVK